MWHLPQCARPIHCTSAQYVVSDLIVTFIIVAEKYILKIVSDMVRYTDIHNLQEKFGNCQLSVYIEISISTSQIKSELLHFYLCPSVD